MATITMRPCVGEADLAPLVALWDANRNVDPLGARFDCGYAGSNMRGTLVMLR